MSVSGCGTTGADASQVASLAGGIAAGAGVCSDETIAALSLWGLRGVAWGVAIAPGTLGRSWSTGKLVSTSSSSARVCEGRLDHVPGHRRVTCLAICRATRYMPCAHRQASSIHGSFRRSQGRTSENVAREACVRRVHVPWRGSAATTRARPAGTCGRTAQSKLGHGQSAAARPGRCSVFSIKSHTHIATRRSASATAVRRRWEPTRRTRPLGPAAWDWPHTAGDAPRGVGRATMARWT